MNRLIVILAALLLSAAGLAGDSGQRLDYSLLEAADPIGDGAIEPRPDKGGTLLLQFWASWCHSCPSLMWDMDELVRRNKDVQYIAVSIDDDPDAARNYIRRHRLFDKYEDHYFIDSKKALSVSLGITTVPTILLVDSDGTVRVRKSGHLNAADLQDLVARMRNPG